MELLVTSSVVSRLEWTYCGSDEKFGGAGGNGNFVGWHASVALPITSADVWAGGLVDKLHMANADGGEVTGGGNGGGHKHFDLGKGLVKIEGRGGGLIDSLTFTYDCTPDRKSVV